MVRKIAEEINGGPLEASRQPYLIEFYAYQEVGITY